MYFALHNSSSVKPGDTMPCLGTGEEKRQQQKAQLLENAANSCEKCGITGFGDVHPKLFETVVRPCGDSSAFKWIGEIKRTKTPNSGCVGLVC